MDSVTKNIESAKSAQSASKNPSPAAGLLAQGIVICGQKAAAKYAGVSTKTIQRFDKEGEEQKPPVRHYFEWERRLYYYVNFLDELKKKEGVGTNEHRLKEQKANADWKDTKAQRELFEFEKEKGLWIRRETAEQKAIAQILAVKRALMGMGRKLAPLLRAAAGDLGQLESIVNTETKAICERFAQGVKENR